MKNAASNSAITAETAIGNSNRKDTKTINPSEAINKPINAFLAISFPTVGETVLTLGSAPNSLSNPPLNQQFLFSIITPFNRATPISLLSPEITISLLED